MVGFTSTGWISRMLNVSLEQDPAISQAAVLHAPARYATQKQFQVLEQVCPADFSSVCNRFGGGVYCYVG